MTEDGKHTKTAGQPDRSLADRYQDYRARIGQDFYGGIDPGEIISVYETGDRHLHGESVSQIETTSGFQLFYKPRDCRSTDLCGELTEFMIGEKLVPEQITGDGFAFQKEVIQKLPSAKAEKEGYYERLGRLTALFYALGSTDMHNGNILCANGCPVIIDTETLLHAKAEGFAGNGEFSLDYGEIFPDYLMNAGESMVLPRFYGYMQTSPLIPGKECHPEGYESCFIHGFRESYYQICESREGILRILKRYKEAPFRIVLRSTQYYMVKILLYQNAHNDSKREHILKSLEKGLSGLDLKRWAPVLAWERGCICEGDVPYFCFTAGGRGLYGALDSSMLIPGFLERSPIEYAMWRMEQMCENDLAVQTAYIKASLKHIDGWKSQMKETTNLRQPGFEQVDFEQQASQNTAGSDLKEGCTLLSAREAVSEVEETIRKLWEEHIPLSNGGCLWHTPMTKGKVGCLFGLAEGFSGIAVFTHTCSASPLITGESGIIAKKLSAACFQTLACFGEYLLERYPDPPEERIISRRFNGDFGFCDGLSGYLWAVRQCRDEDPERADRLLEGFQSWKIEAAGKDAEVLLDHVLINNSSDEAATDCLEGGRAAKAAEILLSNEEKGITKEKLEEAGTVLKRMIFRKKGRGCYQVFRADRRSYFLPAFLRGDTGIAYILLHYADYFQRVETITN